MQKYSTSRPNYIEGPLIDWVNSLAQSRQSVNVSGEGMK